MPKTIKLHFVEKFTEGDKDEQLEAMRKYFEFVPINEAQAIYCGSISVMSQAINFKLNTNKPLITYCWDYYKWAHEGATNFNWKQYAEFLKLSDLIIVPSSSQQLRLKELLGLDSVVVKTGIKTYEHEVSDMGFILDPVRYYPEENRTWAEEVANELGIPIVHSEHQFTLEEFRDLVASCTFMTCAFREASTGGLTLMEGLNLGKPSLVSNSPYMGARDYLEDLGYYFQYDDKEDLKKQMLKLWTEKPKVDIIKARKHLKEFTFDKMAKNLHKHICVLLNK